MPHQVFSTARRDDQKMHLIFTSAGCKAWHTWCTIPLHDAPAGSLLVLPGSVCGYAVQQPEPSAALDFTFIRLNCTCAGAGRPGGGHLPANL